MIDKLIIDDAQIELDEKASLPYTYQFSTAKTHTVKYALSDTDEISASAFANCTYMTKVKFPPEIKMIKRRAFENCVRLNNVTIPETIKYIGANVWNGCTGMTEMHFEGTTPPDNYAEIPAGCVVYIPNDSKYVKVEQDENGNNLNMNPDAVKYYTKTFYNMYNEVAANLIEKSGTEYYYDQWTNVAPNEVTIEEKNRIPLTSINFEQNSIRTTKGSTIILKHEIVPENATNKQIYFVNSEGEKSPIQIVDTSVPGEIMIQCNEFMGGMTTISIYAESGISSSCSVRSV